MKPAARAAQAGLPPSGRQVLLAALLVAAAVLASLMALAWYERRAALASAGQRGELLARVLTEHATSTMDTASLTLRALAESIALQPSLEGERLQTLLSQSAVQGLPALRSLAVLGANGLVLASTQAGELGLVVDVARLGPLPPPGHEALLPLLPGRGLADLPALTASAAHMLPLLRRVRLEDGQTLLLLALINPEVLSNHLHLTLSDGKGLAWLSSYEGQLLAATEAVPQAPGAYLQSHPIFSEWLPEREHGSYLGAGVLPGSQVVAFRVAKFRPLLVSVEQDQASALQAWRDTLGGLLALGLGALSLIGGAASVAMRSLSARERARQALNAAHEQVAQREREMTVLLRSLQELVFRTDAEGVISYVNARWEALSQQGVDQALGQPLQDLVEPGERAQVAALFDPDVQLGARSAAISVRGGDGGLRYFDIAVVPLLSQGQPGPQLLGFAGSAVDVTERMVSKQRLQQQLALTGLLLEISPLPVAMYNLSYHYLSVNQAWEDFSGLSRAKIMDMPVGRSLPPAEAAQHRARDAQLLAQGGQLRYETQVQDRDGHSRDMLITKVLVPDETGGVLGILCTLMDISEFRDAERATREARDVAQQASKAKSEFLANMSHELRTPLQSILGFSELALKKHRDPDTLAAMLGEIYDSGQGMLALVNDLLDLAKIESALSRFELEDCDLRALIQPVARELAPLLARKRLRLLLDLPERPLQAQLAPTRIAQVLRNVLANAIKFSPPAGLITVAAGLTRDEAELHMRVSDQGPGIPAAELERIFEAFVQSSSTRDGAGGTGLGLAICRQIIEGHGGRISAANRAEGGAVFDIYLPALGSPR